ncbi:MAG: aminotransferase class V-fold PLP-dependent enzyme [Gemmatimonadetes bacterium]|nr:aminotransferase class V-fold PLP-dependent enzyme [Gemmatimonadota bacterium]MBT8404643.1 aminotransferase class V-fold PLP-dependent enzyme [Gemmatimonadota bacterium]NNK61861.1 aminotransferase class V-fold PLP-dependent enzyme [Gemmatimonadota bacterium]
MSPLARPVEDAILEGVRRKRAPASISPADFFEPATRLRDRFGRLVGAADAQRVAVLPAVSYGIAVAARNLPVERGQRIVVVAEQFPGNVYAWRRSAADRGGEVVTVARPPGSTPGAAWNADLLEAITPETAVVAVPTVHWTDGTRFDLEAVGARCRAVGAALVVDGTQSVGAVPFDVGTVQPDALVVAGYKWMLGPYAVALGWFGPRFDDGVPLEETWIARAGSEDFGGLVDYVDEYQSGAIRYDVGERSNFALLPGAIAGIDLLLDWTPERISETVRRLSRPLFATALEAGFRIEADDWRSPHLFGLRMPEGLQLGALRDRLAEAGISVSIRGTSLRVSPHVYNDEADIAALTEVLVQTAGRT